MADVPEFDPSQPFETAPAGGGQAPEFDETKPFTAGPAEPPSGLSKAIGGIPDALAASPEVQALQPKNIGYAADQVGRNIPVVGPAVTKAGYGLSAFLSSITPDSVLPDGLRGKTIGDLYDHFKDQDDKTQAMLAAENPRAHMAGQLMGGAMLGNPLALEAGAGANLATRVGTGLVNAGTYGELMKTDAALRGSTADQAEDAGNMTAAVGAIAPAAELAAGVGKAVAPALSDFAENRAASSLGMTKAIRNKLGNDKAEQAGRVALDQGIVTPFASTEDKIARAQALQKESGQQIGQVMDTLDQAGVKKFNPLNVATEVDNRLGNTYADTNLGKSLAGQYENTLNDILEKGDKPISFADAQDLKQHLQTFAYPGGAPTESTKQIRQALGILTEQLDQAVADGAKELPNSPELLEALQNAKLNYGGSKTALRGLKNKLSAELGNRFFGLTDIITGSAAAAGSLAHGNPMPAVAGGAAIVGKKVLEKYGQNTAAWGADKISKLLQTAPEALGKYAPILQNAAQRGPTAVAVSHYLLSQQDHGYQDMLDKIKDQGDDTP